LFTPPVGQTPSSMREAANFLNSLVEGKTLSELQRTIKTEMARRRQEIDTLAAELVESGLVIWEGGDDHPERLIVRGRANLLTNSGEAQDLEKVRTLFDDLERKRDIADFLELAEDGEGVRIFIGSENKLFSLSGSSLVVSPDFLDDPEAAEAEAYAEEMEEIDEGDLALEELIAERDQYKDRFTRALADAECCRFTTT